MYRCMTTEETDRFIDVQQRLVGTYNFRKHRMIGMSPTETERERGEGSPDQAKTRGALRQTNETTAVI